MEGGAVYWEKHLGPIIQSNHLAFAPMWKELSLQQNKHGYSLGPKAGLKSQKHSRAILDWLTSDHQNSRLYDNFIEPTTVRLLFLTYWSSFFLKDRDFVFFFPCTNDQKAKTTREKKSFASNQLDVNQWVQWHILYPTIVGVSQNMSICCTKWVVPLVWNNTAA